MKLIISGVPCCGKTHFGDWLRDNHGFLHINFEDQNLYLRSVIMPSIVQGLPCWLSSASKNIVVSWGYPPTPDCYRIIQCFQHSGFIPWWFDADHAVARARYVLRDGEGAAQQFFDPQAFKIKAEAAVIDRIYSDRKVTTLTESGYTDIESLFGILKK